MLIVFVRDVDAGFQSLHRSGQIVDLPDHVAAEMIRRGLAKEPPRVREAVSETHANARKTTQRR